MKYLLFFVFWRAIIIVLPLPTLATEGRELAMRTIVEFLLSVTASVIGNLLTKFIEYISKWFDR